MPVMTAAEDAEGLLNSVWRPRWGTTAVPVDPIWIARELGVEVYSSPLDHDVSGVLLRQDDGVIAIYLNRLDALVRQRFTCGHELGHYVRRRVTGLDKVGFVDKRDMISATGSDPEERYANAFSASLLMPADAVVDRHRRNPSLPTLAAEFSVSMEAMRIRLETLRLA